MTFAQLKRVVVATLGAALVVALAVLAGRLYWASEPPKRPSWMPMSSVWSSGPHTPLETHPVGTWVGCSPSESLQSHCWFLDGLGQVTWQGSLERLSERKIGAFSICPGDKAFFVRWSSMANHAIRIVCLEDGDFLVPPSDLTEIRGMMPFPPRC
jgi:hypothetical protein